MIGIRVRVEQDYLQLSLILVQCNRSEGLLIVNSCKKKVIVNHILMQNISFVAHYLLIFNLIAIAKNIVPNHTILKECLFFVSF